MTHRRSTALGPLITAALLLTGCGLTDREWRTLDAWLTCNECINGERAAARGIGQKAVPEFSSALVGPPARRQTLVRAQFANSYPGVAIAGLTRDVYADLLLANYVATYQKRAAIPLEILVATMRRPRSMKRWPGRRPVRTGKMWCDSIRYVVTRSNGVPFGGTLSPLRVSFGDTLTLTGSATQPFNGDELADIDGAPFPPADVVLSRGTNELKIAALGEPGAHGVAISNVGTGTSTEIATLTIGSAVDANDRAMLSCSSLRCSVDSAPRIVPWVSPLPDVFVLVAHPTSDRHSRRSENPPRHFPTRAAHPPAVTATLNWQGAANLDLRWQRCSNLASAGNDSGATGANPERSSVTISDDCWALLVLLLPGSAPAPRAFARLRITSP